MLTQLRDRIDAGLLLEARIKGVSNYAVGENYSDVPAATRHSIQVRHTPGVLTGATADIDFALPSGIARRVVEADHFVRAGKFHGWEPDMLLGKDVIVATLGWPHTGASPGPRRNEPEVPA